MASSGEVTTYLSIPFVAIDMSLLHMEFLYFSAEHATYLMVFTKLSTVKVVAKR